MRIVTGDQHVARFATQAIANPLGGIVWLKVARRGKLRQRVAGPPESFGRLACAELAAVPHDRWSRAAGSRVSRRASHCQLADRRQRTPRVDLGPDRVAVMDEEQMHRPAQAVRAYEKIRRYGVFFAAACA